MNKEYIDKHEAYLLLKQKAETYILPATKEAYEKAAILIDSMECADVQPVKHGRWKLRCYGDYPYCSSCNNEPKSREMTLYCPNCGARMDGDSE